MHHCQNSDIMSTPLLLHGHCCYLVMVDLWRDVFDSCLFFVLFYTPRGAAQGRLVPPFFHLKLSTSIVQKPGAHTNNSYVAGTVFSPFRNISDVRCETVSNVKNTNLSDLA